MSEIDLDWATSGGVDVARHSLDRHSGSASERFVAVIGAILDDNLAAALETGPDEFLTLLREMGMTRLADSMARGWVRHAAQVAARNRPATIGPRQSQLAQQMYEETGPDGKRRYTVAEIAGEFGVTRPTIYRALGALAEASAAAPSRGRVGE